MLQLFALVVQVACTGAFVRGLLLTTRSEFGSPRYRRSFVTTVVLGVAAFAFACWVFTFE